MPSWKKVIVSGSDASLNSLNVLSITGSLQGTASFATTASYAVNGGVTQLFAGPNITLAPTTGVGQVTISSTGTGTYYNTSTGSYGSFYDTTTQLNPIANIPRSMSLNTTDITNGVSVSGSSSPFNTYIKVTNAGVYNIQFSAQLIKTDFGTDYVDIWLRRNGVDLLDSATSVTLKGNNDRQVAAWNWFSTAGAGDYYQIMWASADTNTQLLAESATGVHPGVPSVIVTANRIDTFLSNTGSFSGSFNGVLNGTASYATQAATASYVVLAQTASFVTTAQTASYVNPLNQAVNISGSLNLTGSIAITGSTATDLVRITQTGTGNAFVVEDNTNPDSTPFVINATGSVGIGTTTPAAKFEIKSAAQNNLGGLLLRAAASANYPALIYETTNQSGVLELYSGSTLTTQLHANGNSFLNGGNVGIGITTPTALLHVNNTTTSASFLVEDSTNPDTTPFIVDSTGNVGIGTTTPSTKLHVSGNAGAVNWVSTDHIYHQFYPQGISAGRFAYFGFPFSGSKNVNIFNETADGNISLGTNNAARLTISPSGNIGIGVSVPTAKVEIKSSAANNLGGLLLRASGSSNTTALIYETTNEAGVLELYSGSALTTRVFANGFTYFNGGNVGIGTTTPNAKLDVTGNAIISGSLTTTSSVFLRNLPNTSTSNVVYYNSSTGELTYANAAAGSSDFPYTGSALITGSLGVTGSLFVTGSTTTDLVRITQAGSGNAFAVYDINSDTTPFVINSSGSVGIGTPTPSSFTSRLMVLADLNGTSGIRAAGAGNHAIIGNAGTNYAGIYGEGVGDDAGEYFGGYFRAYQADTPVNTNIYIGAKFEASSDATNYSVQLKDGTQAAGKVLVSQDASGSANWSTQLSGSYGITGSLTVTGSTYLTGLSSNTTSNVIYINTSTGALSYGPAGTGNAFPYTGSAQITGSLGLTGSITIGNGLNTNLDPYGFVYGTGSYLNGTSTYSAILGGESNKIHTQGTRNVILGGLSNNITGSGAFGGHSNSAIIGGSLNRIDAGGPANSEVIVASYSSSIRDGERVSIIASDESTITNGYNIALIASFTSTTSGTPENSAIIGGNYNRLGSVQRSVILGGSQITASFNDTVYMPNAEITGSVYLTGLSSVATSNVVYIDTATGALSYSAPGGGSAFPYTGSAQITGSLGITGSLSIGQSLNASATTTANIGSTTIYSVSTSSYDGAWFEYTARSGSNARAGQLMSIWQGSVVNFTETTTTDFGSTSGLSLGVYIVNGAMALTASADTNGWNIKTIVRSI